MKIHWLTTHRNWYEGVASYTPSTNNALESVILVLKKKDTFRERLPLSRFLTVAKTTVEKLSNEFKNGDRVFISSTSIPIREWTKASKFPRSLKEILLST